MCVTPLHSRRRQGGGQQRLEDRGRDGSEDPIGYDLRDLVIVTDDTVAFSHALHHYSGKTRAGALDMWMRATTGYRKSDDVWRVTPSIGLPHSIPRVGKRRSTWTRNSG